MCNVLKREEGEEKGNTDKTSYFLHSNTLIILFPLEKLPIEAFLLIQGSLVSQKFLKNEQMNCTIVRLLRLSFPCSQKPEWKDKIPSSSGLNHWTVATP